MTVTSSRACAWALELVILKIGTGGITWIRQASGPVKIYAQNCLQAPAE